ncbi:MAG: AsmA family protein [Terriglobia bacterium]
MASLQTDGRRAAWYRSKAFLIVALLVGLLVVGLLAAPYFLNLDRYRTTIVDLLKQETGREVAIEKLRLHLLPLRVDVLNFRVLNPPGFPAGDTLVVERIGVGLAWWPLLRRELEIGSVTFDGLRLNLLANERRQTNYDTLEKLQRKSKRRQPSSATKTAAAPLVTLTEIDRVRLANVEVSTGSFWRRSKSKKIYPLWRVTGIAVEARHFDFTQPDWQKQVEAELPLGDVEVFLPILKEALRFPSGELRVKDYVASGEFRLAAGKLRARGRLRVPDLDKPVIDFHLTAGELNVPEIASLLAPNRSANQGPATGGGSRRTQLLAKGTVEVKKVNFPPVSAENLKAKVRLYTTRLEIDPLTLALYDGTYKGMTRINLAQEAMATGISFTLAGVDIGQASAAAHPQHKSQVTGRLENKMDLRLELGAADPLETVSGRGSFAVRDGTFPGVNLGGTLGTMAKFLQLDIPEGDTRFNYFGGDLRVARKRVHSQSLKLKAEGLEGGLSGSVGFDQTLNYTGWGVLKGGGQSASKEPTSKNPLRLFGRVVGTVMKQTVGQMGMMRVPFSVRGTVDDPKFSLAGTPQPVATQSSENTAETQKKKKKRFRIF